MGNAIWQTCQGPNRFAGPGLNCERVAELLWGLYGRLPSPAAATASEPAASTESTAATVESTPAASGHAVHAAA